MGRLETIAGGVVALVMALALAACAQPTPAPRQAASSGERAEAQLAAAATSFVVRFAPDHPMARAQTLEGLAAHNDAEGAARSTLETLPELRGLCFDRFTLGGVEVVLFVCEPTPLDGARDAQSLWMARFQAMESVERAEPNATFVAEQR